MRWPSVLVLIVAAGVTVTAGEVHADACNPPTTPATQTFDLPAGDGTFRCASMNIPSGVTIKFNRNATNTPVTFEITNTVTIAGKIDVSGASGGLGSLTVQFRNGGLGGPGGFDGGTGANNTVSTTGGTGLGPGGAGGGDRQGSGGGGGSFLTGGTGQMVNGGTGTPGGGGGAYGGSTVLPLIGGSGGGGGGTNSLGNTGGGVVVEEAPFSSS